MAHVTPERWRFSTIWDWLTGYSILGGIATMGKTEKQRRYEKRLEEKLLHDWEVIRRHPDYRMFCDSREFNRNNLLIEKAEYDVETDNIKRKFGLMTIYHYSCDFTPKQCFGGDLFVAPQLVRRIWLEDTSRDMVVEFPEDHIEEGDPKPIPLVLPREGEFIYLEVDVSPGVRLEDVQAETQREFERARAVRKKDKTRFHYDPEIFIAWDLRKIEGKSALETIRTIWPAEYEQLRPMPDDEFIARRMQKYKAEGFDDTQAEEKAWDELETSSGLLKLYARLNKKLKRMDRELGDY